MAETNETKTSKWASKKKKVAPKKVEPVAPALEEVAAAPVKASPQPRVRCRRRS